MNGGHLLLNLIGGGMLGVGEDFQKKRGAIVLIELFSTQLAEPANR